MKKYLCGLLLVLAVGHPVRAQVTADAALDAVNATKATKVATKTTYATLYEESFNVASGIGTLENADTSKFSPEDKLTYDAYLANADLVFGYIDLFKSMAAVAIAGGDESLTTALDYWDENLWTETVAWCSDTNEWYAEAQYWLDGQAFLNVVAANYTLAADLLRSKYL